MSDLCYLRKPRMCDLYNVSASTVSSNPTGGNFIFLRQLDANFVQKGQKCQICVIYENLVCVAYITFQHQLSLHYDSLQFTYYYQKGLHVSSSNKIDCRVLHVDKHMETYGQITHIIKHRSILQISLVQKQTECISKLTCLHNIPI